MNELHFLGYLVGGLVTLGGFIAIIMKFIQPINDLRVVIQKLNDNIDVLKSDNTKQTERIDKQDERIDKIDHRVDRLETKVELYHHEGQ